MSHHQDSSRGPPDDRGDRFVREVQRQVERARQEQGLSFWQGLALVGAVGWTVALPAVAAALIGRWLDAELTTGPFWGLSLLSLGVTLGCIAAWRRVRRDLGM